MGILPAILKRKSIRHYSRRDIEDDKLRRVLEAARLAPSAKNRQEWKFIVVKDNELKQKLVKAAKEQKFVGEANVVIVACGTQPDYIMTCGQPAYTVDIAIAVEHMALQAAEEGLGSCWIGAFYEDEVKEILGIPQNVRVPCMLTLGYPATEMLSKPRQFCCQRKKLEEIVYKDRWGKQLD